VANSPDRGVWKEHISRQVAKSPSTPRRAQFCGDPNLRGLRDETARAEQERARAEQEHARAEQLAERLRALGFEP
jgi:hypothetical protein